MKILFLSAYLPGRGLHGGSSRIFEILHYLHRHHDISLLCFKNRYDDDSRVGELKTMCRKISIFMLNEQQPFHIFPYEAFIEYQSEELRKKLKKLVQKEKFDLVQYEYVQMGIYHRDIPEIPSIITEHEVNFLAHQKQIPYLKGPIKKTKRFYDSLQMMKRELEILQTMERVICMNQFDAQALEGYISSDRLAVLPHGVDTNYFHPDLETKPEPFAIGFFGAYHHYPNVDAVLHFVKDIFPLVKERVPAAHFYAIGIHPPEEMLALNERADVSVTGFVPDIRIYLTRCNVVVAPLRLGLGMRVKMLEAMAMGKPIVATDLACAGLEVSDGQHLIVANSPESIAESLCYLMQDRACADALGVEARKLVEDVYNYQSIGRQLQDIYSELIGRHEASGLMAE